MQTESISVALIRRLNNERGHSVHLDADFVPQCPQCGTHFTPDLARYHCPMDAEVLACSLCSERLVRSTFPWSPPSVSMLPLAQRFVS